LRLSLEKQNSGTPINILAGKMKEIKMDYDREISRPPDYDDEKVAKWMHELDRGIDRRKEESEIWSRNAEWENANHWSDDALAPGQDRVTVNKIGAWVNTRIPAMIFRNPGFSVRPLKPDGYIPIQIEVIDQETGETSVKTVARHKVVESLLNYIVTQPSFGLYRTLRRFMKASLLGYGALKVGYFPEFDDQKKKKTKKAKLVGWVNPDGSDDDGLISDKWFIDWVPHWRVIIDPDGENEFYDHSWVACEYIEHIDDVRSNKLFKNTADLTPTLEDFDKDYEGTTTSGESTFTGVEPYGKDRAEKVRLFEIIDLRKKRIIVIAEGHGKALRDDPLPEGILHSPYVFFRPIEILGQFYPRPPVKDLIPINDEYNKYRSNLMSGTRRAARKFVARKSAFDEPNMAKLTSPNDMAIAETDAADIANVIVPVNMPGMSGEVFAYGQDIPRDFNEVAGQPGEARGQATAKTATQANIMQQSNSVREDDMREMVGHALRELGKKLLDSVQKNMTTKQAITIAGEDGQAFSTMVDHDMIVGDFDIDVSVIELMPRNTDVEKAQFEKVLQILAAAPWLVSEPSLADSILDMFQINSTPVRDGLVNAAKMQMQAAGMGQGPQDPVPGNPADMASQKGGQ
jgi:hypothetical protein